MTVTAVIGAGIAGLRCAQRLADAGHEVVVLDKGRGPGGRCATRRVGDWHFDHGAQYFTARSEAFRQQALTWLDEGTVARWEGTIVALESPGTRRPLTGQPDRYVGTPGMNAMAKSMAGELDVRCGVRIDAVERSEQGWLLQSAGHEPISADRLVVTAPPVQTAALLEAALPALAREVAQVAMQPCWAVMLGFAAGANRPPLEFDAAFVDASPVSWMASSTSRPDRPATPGWLIHGSFDWSALHRDSPSDEVIAVLSQEFQRLTGIKDQPDLAMAHRWLYAQADQPLDCEYRVSQDGSVWIAGDWLAGSRVEGAWRSGQAAAEAILEN